MIQHARKCYEFQPEVLLAAVRPRTPALPPGTSTAANPLPLLHPQVGSDQFVPLLTRTDDAIAALSGASHFSDTANYLNRFKSLQARALQLVKTYVQATLQATSDRLQQQLKDPAQAGRSDASLTIYVQYQAVAEPIKVIMTDIAKRAAWYPEYSTLLSECQATYFKQRQVPFPAPRLCKLGASA